MLDPLTALSLASNILQFIDFTSRVVSNCRHIYNSANEALPEHYEYEIVTSDLLRLSARLKIESPSQQVVDDGTTLRALVDSCLRIADELLDRLRKYKVPDNIQHRKWKSFREALETVWSRKDLDELSARLTAVRSQMEFHILISFREKFDLVTLQNSRRFDWLDTYTKSVIRNLQQNRTDSEINLGVQTSKITDLHRGTRDHVEEQHVKTRDVILQAFHKYGHSTLSDRGRLPQSSNIQPERDHGRENVSMMTSAVHPGSNDSAFFVDQTGEDNVKESQNIDDYRGNQEALKKQAEMRFKQAILESLTFPYMQDRHFDIVDAHTRTFEWIYDSSASESVSWSSLSEWLSHGSGIYWVNGKAGSGKSTLMRYILEDQRTSRMLATWAGSPEHLTIAAFFFWNSGSPDQASQLGLLRSILHGIISRKHSLIPSVFPNRWRIFEEHESLDVASDEFSDLVAVERANRWTLEQLKLAFQRLLVKDSSRICLFIDGLDEYHGDSMDTINLFQYIMSPKLKVCLSSRPWLVFENAFSACPQLKLQDLTFSDIRTYVNDTLSEDERMKALCDMEPLEAPNLVEEIVLKAAGVFLWVKLVVASLRRGLTNHDKVLNLQRRVRLLPSELEKLFTYMMRQIEPVYLEEGSQIFLIMLRSQDVSTFLGEIEGLCAIDLSFAIEADTTFTIESPTKLLSDSEVTRMIGDIDCHLRVRCSGLLEIPTPRNLDLRTGRLLSMGRGNARVQWLHRTVKDFLETDEAQAILRSNTGEKEFSPSLSLLRSNILRMKTWFTNIPVHNGLDPLPGLIARAGVLAHHAERELSRTEPKLLDELPRTVHQLQHGSNCTCGERDDIFGDFSIKYVLPYYFEEKLCTSPLILATKSGISYLDFIIWSERFSTTITNTSSKSYLVMNKKLLAQLLQHGCNPNHTSDGETPWQKALFQILKRTPPVEHGPTWIDILRLFLQYGADKTATIGLDGNSFTVRRIITNVFSRDFPDESASLNVILPELPISQRVPLQGQRRVFLWFRKRLSIGQQLG